MAERIAETVLRYKTDTASIAAAQQANQQVAASFASVEEAAARLGLSSQQVAQLNAQLGTTTAAVSQELTKQTYLADRLAQAAQARASAEAGTLATLRAEAFAGAAAGGGGNSLAGLQSTLQRARAAAIALPGVGFQSPITLALQGGATLAGLGPGGLAIGAAIAAVGGAFLAVADKANKATEAVKGTAQAFLEVSESTLGKTRAQLEQERADLISLVNLRQQNADLLTEQIRARERTLSAEFGNAPGGFIDLGGTLGGLQAASEQANKELTDSQDQLNALNIQLAGTGETAGDAAARFKDLQDQLAENLKVLAERETQIDLRDLQNQLDAQRMTREEREKETAALSEYLVVAQHYLETTNETEDAHRQIAVAVDDARARMAEMTGVTYSFADAAERYALKLQQLQDQFDLYGDAIENEGAIQEKLIALETELAQARVDASEKLADIAAKASERVNEIELEAGDRRAEIVQNAQDAIYKILRDAGREQVTAVAFRDALAFVQSRQKAADALEDQQKQEEKQLAQQEKAQAKQLASAQKSQDDQIRTTLRALDKETRIKQDAIYMQEQALFKAQYDTAQIALYGSNNQIAIHSSMWSELDRVANNGAMQLARNFANALIGGVTSGINVISSLGSYSPLPAITGTQALNNAIDQRIAQTIFPGTQRSIGTF